LLAGANTGETDDASVRSSSDDCQLSEVTIEGQQHPVLAPRTLEHRLVAGVRLRLPQVSNVVPAGSKDVGREFPDAGVE
jgi:hypothetical protein